MAIFQTMALLTPIGLKRLVCDGTELDQYVYFGSQAEKEAFQNISCALSPQQLITSQQVLLQNLQPSKVLSEVSCPLLSLNEQVWCWASRNAFLPSYFQNINTEDLFFVYSIPNNTTCRSKSSFLLLMKIDVSSQEPNSAIIYTPGSGGVFFSATVAIPFQRLSHPFF